MRKIHLNFAHNSHKEAQKINSQSALNNGFDVSYNFSLSDIDTIFYQKNKHILDQSRGAGYWIWKPYFILKVLNNCEFNDIIFYTDSGSQIINPINPLIKLLDKQDITPFKVDGALEIHNTKRDCFILMDCDEEKYHKGAHLNAAFILTKKTNMSIDFFTNYLNYCCNEKCVTDMKSGIKPEHIENRGHRHDQSIYSLLCKKYDLNTFRDPSQWGNNLSENKDLYDQIIEHTRFNG
jgi:hypothetical protein